jgi:RES domain-containing protein
VAELTSSILPFFRFSQRAYRVVPDIPDVDPLDASFAAKSNLNRWNMRGEPTLYLAGDQRVLATEWARHLRTEHPTREQVQEVRTRRIYEMQIAFDLVLDLRDPLLCALLSMSDPPFCFLRSKALCQSVASRLRRETSAQALLVPSMALLDQPERWAMVVFVNKLPTYPGPFLSSVRALATLPAAL